MPIPSTETQLVKAEIEAALFRQAFIELAVEFARRDRKGFGGAAGSVRRVLVDFPIKKFVPPAQVEGSALDVKLLQESGLGDAIARFDTAVHQVLKRLR
jgi:hypothetical protein